VIPRYQKILFVVLLVAALGMSGELWHLRQRAHQRLLAGEDSAPTKAPEVSPNVQATLVVANDADGSLLVQQRALRRGIDDALSFIMLKWSQRRTAPVAGWRNWQTQTAQNRPTARS